MKTFQELIARLQEYWAKQGCVILQPLDLEVGAGTFHPATFLHAIGPEPWYAAYVQPCRRPTDGRYGENPNRVQHYYQFQVALKPSPDNIQMLYLDSLRHIGIDPAVQDIRFVEDNWESPTLGAWGLGWEVWQNGMEVSQYTYFQQVGGLPCHPVLGELTYGLERLAMGIFEVNSILDIPWSVTPWGKTVTYGDVFLQNEVEMSTYHFEQADVPEYFRQFEWCEKESKRLTELKLPLPAYEMLMKASHMFNILDARHAISVTARQGYILRLRTLSRGIAECYLDAREKLGFPLNIEIPHTISSNVPSSFPVLEKTTRNDFLLEIGCEELPAGYLQLLTNALLDNIIRQFSLTNISYDATISNTHLFSTPRRLSVLIENLPEATQASTETISGPSLSIAFDANGDPTIPALKFAEKNGVSVKDLIKDSNTNKLAFEKIEAPQQTVDLLPAIIKNAIDELPTPKPMHWGNHALLFARPVHWVTLIYNNALVPATLLGCQTVAHTFGHRVYTTEPISLLNTEYAGTLKNAHVIPSFEERKAKIKAHLYKTAETLNATPVLIENLLDEVTGLVEWPVVLAVPFDKRFLDLPKEVLITSMQQHQKSFAMEDNNKTLIPHFLAVSNIKSNEPAQVIQGNQRVMEARLSDAAFFYQQDKKHSLESRREMTKNVIFQTKLGTLYDKSERFMALAQYLAPLLKIDTKHAVLAASLSQCDLMTDMVGEFPELQGIMGYYYALSDGLPNNVACALNEQYSPRFSGDKLPKTSLGTLLAIAERIDTLVGAFSIHQKPTGNKDPFKLRRHALGLIRLLINIDTNKDLNVIKLLTQSLHVYHHTENTVVNPKTIEETHTFILERLKAYYLDQGYTIFMIQAVFARQSVKFADFDLRIQAIQEFSQWSEAIALSAANKRVSRILEDVPNDMATFFNETLLSEPSEKKLVNALKHQQQEIPPLLAEKNYIQALKNLASLREPIDAFFEQVMINDPNPEIRQNRLAILQALHQLFLNIADISCLT